MAKLGQQFDATAHDTEQREYTPIPDGDYALEVLESDVVETKSGMGLKLTYQVTEGDYEGRRIYGFMNIANESAQAQEIGQKELASLCRAIGLPMIEDSEELHFKRFEAKIGMGKPSKEKEDDGRGNMVPKYPARNEIKRFYFPDEGGAPKPQAANDNTPPPAQQEAAAAKPAGSRPWGKS